MIYLLYAEEVDLDLENDTAGFLENLNEQDHKTRFLNMMHKGCIKQVLGTLGLDVGTANGKLAPVKGKPLTKHEHGEPDSGDFNYSSVVGMLLYLAGHTHPDITYAVNFAERYMFCPKLVHKQALKHIGRYLKATSDKGLIMKPSEKHLKIYSFPDREGVLMVILNVVF